MMLTMLIDAAPPRTIGVADQPALRFGEAAKPAGAWAGRRLIWLGDGPAFELSYWCGTCGLLFKRLEGANETLSLPQLEQSLSTGLDHVDDAVVEAFGALLPKAAYQPMLLQIRPRLIQPRQPGDYFSDEQVATWGLSAFWGLPEYPQTPYYRTWETAIDAGQHLFEFVVPMVPPSWNDQDKVGEYVDHLATSDAPTAVAVTILDVCAPATEQTSPTDYYAHWGLMHFLLDGHHKLQAAAQSGQAIRLLSLVSIAEGLATDGQVERLLKLRARSEQRRV
jgi:hypothetical protein